MVVNPLMAKTAIWQFEIITYAAIHIIASDKFLNTFQYTMRLSYNQHTHRGSGTRITVAFVD